MDDIFTYREAKPYLIRTKRMLKSVRSLENYIEETKKDLFELEKISRKSGKKEAILSFVKKTTGNFDSEYDNYLKRTEAALSRAEHLYQKIMDAVADFDVLNAKFDAVLKELLRDEP